MELLGRVLADHAPVAPPAHSSASRPIKVNPPEEFDGRSSRKLKSFLISCNNAFRGDPDIYANDNKWVTFALSYLRGSVQRHFDHQIEDEEEPHFVAPPWLNSWTYFVEELREMFADPNSEATVEADPDNHRMHANQKFSDFLIEFNVLASQVNWGDRALRHRLKQALPDCIEDNLVLVQEPSGLLEWKHLVLSIDRRYWECQDDIGHESQLKGIAPRNPGAPASTPPPQAPHQMPGALTAVPPVFPIISLAIVLSRQRNENTASRRGSAYTAGAKVTRQGSVVRPRRRRYVKDGLPKRHWRCRRHLCDH